MANWSLPSLTDLYTNFLTYMKARDDDAARLNDSRVTAASNVPDYTKRWNATTQTFQNWLSAAWSSLVLAVAGGGTGATTAAGARTNLDVYSKSEADAAFITSLSSVTGYTVSPVTMTSPATYYDGPSVSLTAGTWLVLGAMNISCANSVSVVGRLSVGGVPRTSWSAYVAWSGALPSGNTIQGAPIHDVITVASTSTVKLEAIRSDMGYTPMLLGTLVCVKIA